MDSIGRLPIEVVELIVGYIDTHKDLHECALISTCFYTVANPKLWQAPSKKGPYSTAPCILQSIRLSQYNPLHATTPLSNHIHKLTFNCDYVTDILKVLAHCPFVEVLVLESQITTEKDVERIFRFCHKLKVLKLRSLKHLTDSSIAALVRLCPHLQDIELAVNPRLSGKSLIALKGSALGRLDLIDFYGLKDDSGRSKYSMYPGSSPSLIDADTMRLLKYNTIDGSVPFPLLTEFNVVPALYPSLTFMDAVTYFIKSHPGLRKLGIACFHLDEPFLEVLASIPDLRQLTIDATALIPFKQTFHRLEELSLDHNVIGNEVFLSIPSTMPHLRHLVIKTTNPVLLEDLRLVIMGCTRLTCIDLSKCHGTSLSLPGGSKKVLYKQDIDFVRSRNQ